MSSPYGVVLYWPDSPEADTLLLLHVAALKATFPAGMAESRATLDIAPTANYQLAVFHNTSPVATITYSAGSQSGTYYAPADFTLVPGDLLSVYAPTSPDATAAGIAITMMGARRDVASLQTIIQAVATFESTFDHTALESSLECLATLTGRLVPSNLLSQTLLKANATLFSRLGDMPTLTSDIRPGRGFVLHGRLTVTHNLELFA